MNEETQRIINDNFLVAEAAKEADPNGISQHTQGAKLDAGKPDLSLLLDFGHALTAVAEVGTYGLGKYTRCGWSKVDDGITRYTAALLRHLVKEPFEENDSDTDLKHAAHAAWNALARLELMIKNDTLNR